MSDHLILDDIDRTQIISTNRKLHHHPAADVRRYWRTLAREAAEATYGTTEPGCYWLPAARIIMAVRFPDRRRHDVGNLYPYVAKPIVDGLVDAGVLPDDDDKHVVGPDLRRDPERGPHRITITLHPIEWWAA